MKYHTSIDASFAVSRLWRATECETATMPVVELDAATREKLREAARSLQPPPPAPAKPSVPGSPLSINTPISFKLPALSCCDRALLTVLRGVDAGQTVSLDRGEAILGRDVTADVCIDDSAVSRRHARVGRRGDGTYWVEDLASKNGTFVGGRQITKVDLKSGDRICLGPQAVVRFTITDEDEDTLQRKMYETATRDGLTGALNRFALSERLLAEFEHARRANAKLSALMLDIDHFKKVNDEHGHQAGDMVLAALGSTIRRVIRVEDLCGRYGGDELVILARGTPREEAALLGERLRRAMEALEIDIGKGILRVTVSMGIAEASECVDPTRLLALADDRLYTAKRAGRNRVAFW